MPTVQTRVLLPRRQNLRKEIDFLLVPRNKLSLLALEVVVAPHSHRACACHRLRGCFAGGRTGTARARSTKGVDVVYLLRSTRSPEPEGVAICAGVT